jgi:hypothetical protein
MTVLRYAYVLALVVWLGGLVTVGTVVAPATFSALERTDGVNGRTRAATVVGEVLRRFHVVSYVAGAVLLLTLIAMKLVGPRPPGFGARLIIVSLMLASSAISGLVVDRAIGQLRASLDVPVSTLPPTDERHARFARLHAMSTLLMGAGLLGGLALCYWETRE